MSFWSKFINFTWNIGDTKRDKKIPLPEDVEAFRDISYVKDGDKYNLLDIFIGKKVINNKKIPLIINVHGGGYVYGDKNLYQRYAMLLASFGYAVISFSYHLAPKYKFPTPLIELDKVVSFAKENADKYHFDIDNTFLVGDSAGGNLSFIYGVCQSSEEYRKLFDRLEMAIKIKAIIMNCPAFSLFYNGNNPFSMMHGISKDYYGRINSNDGRLYPLNYLNEHFPHCLIMTAEKDFLRSSIEKDLHVFDEKNVDYTYIYCKDKKKKLPHVFHLNIIEENARKLNNREDMFLKEIINQ